MASVPVEEINSGSRKRAVAERRMVAVRNNK